VFGKVVIANRGEIAVRIIQTCKRLGIQTVAVYSQADRSALHVRLADEAFEIGPAPAAQSYLNADKILTVAKTSGARAIHPGYGFLSENDEFAEAVEHAGLVWVGPPPTAMARMGDKLVARQVAQKAEVRVVPGTGEMDSADAALVAANDMGFPLLLKASAGGGGKGMRVVKSAGELPSAFERAQSEALRSFGNPALYLEKFVRRAKHIEIQVFGDTHGNHVWLGERECSIQRRHQKLIEESPSVALSEQVRQQMGQAAVALARGCGYVNAGTVEFLFDVDTEAFYFLEMNARLQVEHPVTEMVTGLDLVAWQLRVAAAEVLPLQQEDVQCRGVAIECRLYAEDPLAFLPDTGRLKVFLPPHGEGLRLDSGVVQGDVVNAYYDPLLAKFIVHGADRTQAIARMRGGLERFAVAGVTTNLAYHRAVMADADFQQGRHLTDFVDAHKMDVSLSQEVAQTLAQGAAYLYQQRQQRLEEAFSKAQDGWPQEGPH